MSLFKFWRFNDLAKYPRKIEIFYLRFNVFTSSKIRNFKVETLDDFIHVNLLLFVVRFYQIILVIIPYSNFHLMLYTVLFSTLQERYVIFTNHKQPI